MAKLVLSRDGKVVNHYFIDKTSISIGRDVGNDIAIDDAQLGEGRLSITRVGKDAIAENMPGQDGVRINGKPLTRQILQHLDIIELGQHQLRYMSASLATDADLDRTMLIETVRSPDAGGVPTVLAVAPVTTSRVKLCEASVEFISGPAPWKAGKIIPLEQVVTTFGDPGEQMIVLTRRPNAITLSHVEGRKLPRVNGETIIPNAARALKAGDLIEGAGYKLRLAS